MSSRCTHVGCPTQPNGPLFPKRQRSSGDVTIVPTPPVRLRLSLPRQPVRHGGQPNRGPRPTPARPVRVLDPQRPALPRPALQRRPCRRHRRRRPDPRVRTPGRRAAGQRPRVVALPTRTLIVTRRCAGVHAQLEIRHERTDVRRRPGSAHADRAVPATDAAPRVPTARTPGRCNRLRQAREPPSDRRIQGARWHQPRLPAQRSRARERRDRVVDREPRPVGRLRRAALRREGDDLRPGRREPGQGGRDARPRRRDHPLRSRLRRDPRARRATHRQTRLPLHPLGGRAVAHRRRRDRDPRDARGRAAHRHDHRPGRRRQRRGRRVHRREDASIRRFG